MKPQEALYYLQNFGSGIHVPQIYRDMDRHLLEALVEECNRPSGTEIAEEGLRRWARQPFKMPNWADPKDKKKDEAAAPVAAPPVAVAPPPEAFPDRETIVTRAIRKPDRLSGPGRRRAAFRHNYARCGSIAEAAARTGVDTRTVRRWRKAFPDFARDLDGIVAERRRRAVDDVVLSAGQVEVRPIFHRGQQVGSYVRRNRALDLYLLKQADAEALRAEKRREAAEAAKAAQAAQADIAAAREAAAKEAERDFDARVAAAVEKAVALRISQMSASAGHPTAPADDEFTSVFNNLEPAAQGMAHAR